MIGYHSIKANPPARWLLALIVAVFPLVASGTQTPATITVVLDDNYPPYSFLDEHGNPQGILKDLWSLWEQHTGIHVVLRPMDWNQALAAMKSGKADVIDTIFDTPARRTFLQFSEPYASLDVNLFFHKGISGITNADSLRGFAVGVKAGDACIDYLTERGITNLKSYPSYDAEIDAAIHKDIKVMCIDKPPAIYLLNRKGEAGEFRFSPPLYVGHFHWAVAKGHTSLKHVIESGFSQITPAERKAIHDRWLGKTVPNDIWLKWVIYVAVGLALIIFLLALWNRTLRSRVAERTRKLSETLDSLKQSEQKLLTILDNVDGYIYLKDTQGRYLFANAAIRRLYKAEMPDIIGSGDENFFDAETAANIQTNDQRVLVDGETLRTEGTYTVAATGETFTCHSVKLPLRRDDGSIYALCGISMDISERKEAEEKIAHMAYHDQLTGLPNRALFLDRLGQVLAVSRRSTRHGAVVFIDLDQFKKINDVYGHRFGDAVLKEIATRLSHCVRDGDTVARFGGDEFVILLSELSADPAAAATQALAVAEKLRASLETPTQIGAQTYSATGSIGVSLFPRQRETVEDLIREADIAMYRAKDRGRNTLIFFEDDMQLAIAERFVLEQELREAVGQDELELFLQSQVDKDGKVIGAESLVRWRHPTRGLIPPAVFIPLAEEMGLIGAIGEWVLRETCRLIVQLNTMGRSFHLAVNVSPRQFIQADFVMRVKNILAETGADPVYLTFEITENLLVDRKAEIVSCMVSLSELGIRFSIDDFGTGYSSLSYLKRLPLNELKIDKSFVQDIPHDPNDVALVETILSMAHHLRFEVVAEGVENVDQFQFLASRQCERFQGYFFHRPEPVEEWLAHLGDSVS